jgi:hypothetical protein
MKALFRLVFTLALAAGVAPLLTGSASGHSLSGTTISCSAVSGTFRDFTASDHPIVWQVKVGGGSFQTVATTEAPVAFVGTGTATASIGALTDELHGASATVQAFATWPTGQSATTSQVITCGAEVSPVTSPPTTTLAPEVSAGEAIAPARASSVSVASPATAVAGVTPLFAG